MYPREIGHTQLASVLGAKGLCYPGPPNTRHLSYLGWEPARGLPVPVVSTATHRAQLSKDRRRRNQIHGDAGCAVTASRWERGRNTKEVPRNEETALTDLWRDDFDQLIQKPELSHFVVKSPPAVLHTRLQHLWPHTGEARWGCRKMLPFLQMRKMRPQEGF